MVTIATQTDHIQELTVVQVDDGTQMQVALEELEKPMEKKRDRKGKGRAKDSEDTVGWEAISTSQNPPSEHIT